MARGESQKPGMEIGEEVLWILGAVFVVLALGQILDWVAPAPACGKNEDMVVYHGSDGVDSHQCLPRVVWRT